MTKFKIGNRQIFYRREGSGSPTVIFEAGMGDISDVWGNVQPVIGRLAQTLSYDRAGLGQSDIPPRPRTCQDMVDDLSALLAGARIAPPYVLVGHSFSGLSVRLFASQRPNEVTGMVLVDCSHEDRTAAFEKVLSEELIARNRAYLSNPSKNSEFVDRIQSERQVRDARRRFDFPLVVLTRGLPDKPDPVWPSADLQRVEQELQLEFLTLSPKSSHVIAEKSGHWIQNDQPELVIEAIRTIIGR